MSTASATQHVPPELWLEIFQWATSYPEAYETDYKPFCATACSGTQATCRDLKTSCALALVCRQWYNCVTEFLYRDVQIGYGQNTLKGALSLENGYSKFVRRAVLPYQYTSTPTWRSEPLPSVQILQLCSQLEVLIRPPSPPLSVSTQQFQFDADSLPMPSLKRLEWNFNLEAERSGGINSLAETLKNAPNLQYLAIGSVPPRTPIMDYRPISLPALETLLISSITGGLMHQVAYRWSLPMLSHLVLGGVSVPDVSPLWETYGDQIEVLELGRHASFLLRDVITSALEGCPHLEELNYHIFFTLPSLFRGAHESIHTVGLHSAPNLIFPPEASWALLEKHFTVLLETLPHLRTIRAFGDWSQILNDPRFAPIYVSLRERGCELVV